MSSMQVFDIRYINQLNIFQRSYLGVVENCLLHCQEPSRPLCRTMGACETMHLPGASLVETFRYYSDQTAILLCSFSILCCLSMELEDVIETLT